MSDIDTTDVTNVARSIVEVAETDYGAIPPLTDAERASLVELVREWGHSIASRQYVAQQRLMAWLDSRWPRLCVTLESVTANAAAESRAARWKAAARCFWWSNREARASLDRMCDLEEQATWDAADAEKREAAAESRAAEAVEVLRSVEWSGCTSCEYGHNVAGCPCCGGRYEDWVHGGDKKVHDSDCALAACLREGKS